MPTGDATCRLRRDHPDIEDGKLVRKYLAPYGDRRHLYIVPGDHALGRDLNYPVVLVEAEKSALALRAWSIRTGRQLLPIATGGCWGWRGKIGKVENSKGSASMRLGHSLNSVSVPQAARFMCCWMPIVPAIRRYRLRELRLYASCYARNLQPHVLEFASDEGVNGPDDYIGLVGDDAMARLFDCSATLR